MTMTSPQQVYNTNWYLRSPPERDHSSGTGSWNTAARRGAAAHATAAGGAARYTTITRHMRGAFAYVLHLEDFALAAGTASNW